MNTQISGILSHLQTGKGITPLEALQLFGCLRLGAHIYTLRQRGYNIATETVVDGKKRYARYWLEGKV